MTEDFIRNWLKVVKGNAGTERICRNCQCCMNLYTKYANYLELPLGICIENKTKENTGSFDDILINSLKPACEKFVMRKRKSDTSEESSWDEDFTEPFEDEED